MNIVHVITGLGDGGAEATLYRLCTADTANSHRVVSLMDGGRYGPLLEAAGIGVTTLRMPRGRLTIRGLRRLLRELRRQDIDVVQTWMYHADLIGGAVARIAGVRRVYWGIRNSDLASNKSRSATMFIAKVNALLSRWIPSGIICCAHRARDVHAKLGYVTRKMAVIPNGYDLGLYRPDEGTRSQLRESWGIDDTVAVIGTVARFDPQKDHLNLLQALSTLRLQGTVFRCVLVGRGMDRNNHELAAMIDGCGLRDDILLLGPRTDVPALMAAFDVHVLPSMYGEAFPNVLAEAMACGTPCIATDVGDSAMIIGDAGWVVPPSNPERLGEAITGALDAWGDPVLWRGVRHAARTRIADHFTLSRMVADYQRAWAAVDARAFEAICEPETAV